VEATLVVHLPADATLTIDGKQTVSTSETRVFTTPPLAPGKEFTYEITARVSRGGAIEEVTRQVTVRGGNETTVSLEATQFVALAR
jgi:uncharacterized protein (TIGR03000 family)